MNQRIDQWSNKLINKMTQLMNWLIDRWINWLVDYVMKEWTKQVID